LKTFPRYFQDVYDNVKKFEVRKDDRGFAIGDCVVLREYRIGLGHSGRSLRMRVTYILRDFPALDSDYVVLGIEPWTDAAP